MLQQLLGVCLLFQKIVRLAGSMSIVSAIFLHICMCQSSFGYMHTPSISRLQASMGTLGSSVNLIQLAC